MNLRFCLPLFFRHRNIPVQQIRKTRQHRNRNINAALQSERWQRFTNILEQGKYLHQVLCSVDIDLRYHTAFVAWLSDRRCQEYLCFLIDCVRIEEQYEDAISERVQLDNIYESYIDSGAPMQINLPSDLRIVQIMSKKDLVSLQKFACRQLEIEWIEFCATIHRNINLSQIPHLQRTTSDITQTSPRQSISSSQGSQSTLSRSSSMLISPRNRD